MVLRRSCPATPGQMPASGAQPSASHRRSLCKAPLPAIISSVRYLTKQEQLVLCIIISLLLLGYSVKTYRTAHPPAQPAETSEP